MTLPITIEAFHGTLVAATVTTITFTAYHQAIEVSNVDGASAIYGTLSGVDPTVGGANTFFLPAAVSARTIRIPLPWPVPADTTVSVKLISAGTPVYHVVGVDA